MKFRAAVFAFIFFIFFTISATVYAAALTEPQIQSILSLLRSFGAEEPVVLDVDAALRGIDISGTATQNCTFTYTMYIGSVDAETGGQVTRVQEFLYVDPATGYYGPITEQAVQVFQIAQGVVSGGTAETTGFGVVGPKTRAKLSEVCEARNAQSVENTTESQPVTPDTTNTIPTVTIPDLNTPIVDQTSQSFFDLVYAEGVAAGLSQSELTTIENALQGLTATTSPTAEGQSGSTNSPLSSAASALLGQLVQNALSQLISNAGPSCGVPGLDFGTPNVLSVFPCPCSGTVLIYMQPVGPHYVSALTYRPGTQQCANFNIPTVGQGLVGKYRPGGVCWVPSGDGCAYIPSNGHILPGTGSSLQ